MASDPTSGDIDSSAIPIPTEWAYTFRRGPRSVTLKRDHWEIGDPATGIGAGIIFGDDNRNARLAAKAPALLQSLVNVMAFHPHDSVPCEPPNPNECGLCRAHQVIFEAIGQELPKRDPTDEPVNPEVERVKSINADLLAALRFYVQTCGNTGASITRETAGEMYAVAMKAIEGATRS